MKMVKSLLLGSAAGLVAVTAGQAADLPVKAKPVEYVKICSLYGAGFYYMPGTDMCIKIGGWVRSEVTWGADNGNMTWGPFAGDVNNRDTSNLVTRERGYITADAREQTAYGTARAYIDVGISVSDTGFTATSSASGAFSSNRAFLQWAGITSGLTQSFFDFYSAPAVMYRAGFFPIEDTGDGGWWVTAYTAQLGNGVSATISAEQRRATQNIIGGTAGALVMGTLAGANFSQAGTGTASGYAGEQAPDVVANLRVDQTWGSAQVMGAVHEVNALGYDTLGASSMGAGHPGYTWGWAVGGGIRLNFPTVAPGDYFQGEVNYTEGAPRYLFDVETSNWEAQNSNTGTYGLLTDCVAGSSATAVPTSTTGCNLTSAWSVNASYEHYWTPAVHESFVGSYAAVSYNSQANAILCTAEGEGTGGVGTAAIAAAGCNNNWSTWGAASRLQWDVTKTFYLGVEVLYEHMDSAQSATGLVPTTVATAAFTPAGGPAGTATTVGGASENVWAATFRIHKDFLP
jgi:hypothetical protein